MENEVQAHLAALQQKVVAFRHALSAESDRGCALFAAAYLDTALSDLLYVSLVANKSIEKDLFEGTALLATFSSRIKMAYYLGLISAACRRDLDIIRSVRNDFAHKLDVNSFATQSVRDRCRSLSFSYRNQQDEPRNQFVSSVMGVLAYIHMATLTTAPHHEKPDDKPVEEVRDAHRRLIEEIARKLSEINDRDVACE